MYSNFKLLLFIILFFLCNLSFAEYRPGYIIKTNGDTIQGQIDYRGDESMSKICYFRDNNTLQTYKPSQLIGFQFLEGKMYFSKKIDNSSFFMESLIKGVLNLYYTRSGKDHYYIERDDMPIRELVYYEKRKITNKGKKYFYKSTRHKETLKLFMYDAPSKILNKVDKLGRPNHKDLILLIEEYHNTVCGEEKCMVYKKDIPSFEMSIEPVIGFVTYKNKDIYKSDKSYLQEGLFLNIWLPRVNEKLFLRTGFHNSNPDKVDDSSSNRFKYYLDIAYIPVNSKLIRPTFSIGLMDRDYSAGLYIKLTEKTDLGLTGTLNFDSKSAPWSPSDLEEYSINLGLKINL